MNWRTCSPTAVGYAREGVAFAQDNMRSYKEYQQRGLITKDQLSGQTYSFYQQQDVQLRTSEHRSMYSYVRLSIDRCTATYV